MKKILLLVILAGSNLMGFAQAEFDVLRIAQTDILGTARFTAMGGAFGALGGDMSAISINPAGIGIYRASELSFSPAFQNSVAVSNLNNYPSNSTKNNMLINGFGYVGTFRTFNDTEISNFNFALTYNKVADFNQNTWVRGLNNTSSLLDRMVMLENDVFGVGHSPYYDFASGVGVLGLNTEQTAYVNPLLAGETTNSDLDLKESGGIHAWNVSMGMNFNHNFYLGVGLGLQNITYERNSSYMEEYEEGGSIDLRNTLLTTGTGLDFKVGLIYKLKPELRIGLAVNSGSYYTLTDVFQSSMASFDFVNPNPKVIGDVDFVDYVVKTPSKWTTSVAYLFGTQGLISLDAEFINYQKMSLRNSNGFVIDEIENFIDIDFRNTVNLRAGGEYRITERLSGRGGIAWNPSPLVADLEYEDIVTPNTRPEYSMLRDTWTASMGFGYRTSTFFVDLAVQDKLSYEHVFPYYYASTTTTNDYSRLTRDKVSMVMTCGLRF